MLCFGLLGNTVHVLAQVSLQEIKGTWKEVRRETKRNNDLPFTDTMQMEISNDVVSFRLGKNTPRFEQMEAFEKNKIKFAKGVNSIEVNDANALQYDDELGTHYFVRKSKALGKSDVQKEISIKETPTQQVLEFTGKWSCYKKTVPEFTKEKFYLKSIKFGEKKKDGVYDAKAVFNNMDSVYMANAEVTISAQTLTIVTEKITLKATISKSDGEELILDEHYITYYLKQFGK